MSCVEWVAGAVVSILGVIIGGWLTWIASNRVAMRTAKRDAYARFLAAVDVYGQAVVRIGQLGAQAVPDSSEPNEALAGIIVLGTKETAELAHRMQQCLADLSMMTFTLRGYPDGWESKVREFWTLRRELFIRARQETGAKPLPERFFWTGTEHQPEAEGVADDR
jgi:hypothetical protein